MYFKNKEIFVLLCTIKDVIFVIKKQLVIVRTLNSENSSRYYGATRKVMNNLLIGRRRRKYNGLGSNNQLMGRDRRRFVITRQRWQPGA